MSTSTITGSERLANLQQSAVILAVERGKLRTRKKINSSAVESDADPTVLHVAKDILESKELDAVNQHDSKIASYIKSVSLPSPFKAGMYLLPVRLIEPVLKRLEDYRRERAVLVDDFLIAYQAAKDAAARVDTGAETATGDGATFLAQAKEKLGSLYDPTDYPPVERVREKFYLDIQVLELQTPGRLKAISRELYERELARMADVWNNASEKIVSVLLEEFKGLTDHLVDRLQPETDGKAKTLRSSTVTKLQEWLSIFDARNLSNDDDLKKAVDKARLVIEGIDPELIRESDALRKEIAEQFGEIKTELDTAITARPARRIDLDA